VNSRLPKFLDFYQRMIEDHRQEEGRFDRADEVISSIRRSWEDDELVLCTLEADLPFPFPVQITSSQIVLPRNNIISGGVVIDCGTAISLS